ncbi:IS3 family transposase, partial [Salibacterium aidingense]
GRRFPSHQQAHDKIFRYIELIYNRKRIHSTLNYLTPVQYYKQQVLRSRAPVETS